MLEGYFQNLNEAQYLNLNNPWWNNRFVYECSYLDKLYMVEGELTLSMLDSAFVMFYDTQLYSNFTKNGESIYDIVSDQEWTLEKLGGIVKDVYADDGDGIRNAADMFGLVSPAFASGRDGFPTAFNVKVAWKDDDGKISVELIDLNRLRFHPVSLEEGCRNFERLPMTPDMLKTTAEAYAAARGADPQECIRLFQESSRETS